MNRSLPLIAIALFLPLTSGCGSAPAPTATAAAALPAPAPSVTPVPAASSTEVPPPATSAEALVDHLGDSPQTAVDVPAWVKDEAIPFENKWIFNRYGRFRRLFSGVGNQDERRYDVVKVELTDGTKQTIYFDITASWNAWNSSP